MRLKMKKEKITSRAYYLWLRIHECDDKTMLPDSAWAKLKRISNNMLTAKFSGDKKKLAEKLLESLEFFEWNDLKNSCSLNKNLNFAINCFTIAHNNYRGRVNALFESGEIVKLGEKDLDGDALKQEFTRTLDSLNIYNTKKVLGKISLKELVEYKNKSKDDIFIIYMELLSKARKAVNEKLTNSMD
jgi:hypothetical protein